MVRRVDLNVKVFKATGNIHRSNMVMKEINRIRLMNVKTIANLTAKTIPLKSSWELGLAMFITNPQIELAKMVQGFCNYLSKPSVKAIILDKGVSVALDGLQKKISENPFMIHKLVGIPISEEFSLATATLYMANASNFLRNHLQNI